MISSIKKDYADKLEERFIEISKAIESIRGRLMVDFRDEDVQPASRLEDELRLMNHHLYVASNLIDDCVFKVRGVRE